MIDLVGDGCEPVRKWRVDVDALELLFGEFPRQQADEVVFSSTCRQLKNASLGELVFGADAVWQRANPVESVMPLFLKGWHEEVVGFVTVSTDSGSARG